MTNNTNKQYNKYNETKMKPTHQANIEIIKQNMSNNKTIKQAK